MKRTLIIGDIHGCHAELMELFDRAALAADDIVISVGDLVDRGPEPSEVVAWFRARPGAVVLMGNHERKHVRAVFSYSQEVTRLQLGERYADDVAWMKGLPYFHETPEVRVVHAALEPGVPLAEQDPAILCGSTAGETLLKEKIAQRFGAGWWHEHYTDDVPVVFGHHVTGAEPLLRDGKVYGIDTGACHGLRLTALSVPDFTLYSVPARADHWPVIARRYQLPLLRAKPWATMSWKKLAETVADRIDDRIELGVGEANEYLAAVTAWAASIRALIPQLLERVDAIATELRATHGDAGFQAAAAAHPAKPLLFLHARGRLSIGDIETRCATPAATFALAEKLGVSTAAITAP